MRPTSTVFLIAVTRLTAFIKNAWLIWILRDKLATKSALHRRMRVISTPRQTHSVQPFRQIPPQKVSTDSRLAMANAMTILNAVRTPVSFSITFLTISATQFIDGSLMRQNFVKANARRFPRSQILLRTAQPTQGLTAVPRKDATMSTAWRIILTTSSIVSMITLYIL